MKRTILFLAFFVIAFNTISADELMENLKNASEQVAQDMSELSDEENLFSSSITFENRSVIMGDLFSDLLANRLLNNSRFKGNFIKGYSPGTFRISDADWVLSGSLYKMGSSYFLSMYLNDPQGIQKKGWEFLIPEEGVDSLLKPSQTALHFGGDIYEPNDSSSTAVELKPEPVVEISDLEIGESGDEDWFYFDVDQISTDTSMYILTAYTVGAMDTYLELYSPGNNSSPIFENDDGEDGNASINYAINETGRWYVKVRGYSSDETGDYDLFISMEMKEAGPGEPDNTQAEASLLEVEGDELVRTADYGDDYDYFKIILDSSIPDDKALVIQTYSDLDLTMTLLDQYDNEIETNDDSGQDGNPKLVLPGQEEGTWYAVVYPYDNGNLGSYTIRAYLIDIVKDEYENDNSMEEASLIETNAPAQQRTFMPSNDEDWIKLVVEQPSEFIIETKGSIDTFITLYDKSGEFLVEDDDSGEDNNARIFEQLDEGVYHIQVTQYESEGNEQEHYSISVRKL